MAVLNIGYTWPSAGQFTSTNMNNSVNLATFASGAVDSSSTTLLSGKIAVKDAGITTGKLADDSVTPAKIKQDEGEFFLDDVTAKTTKLTPFAVAQSSSTMALDLDNGNFQIVTLTSDVTTVSAMSNLESGKQFTILIKPSGAEYSITGWDTTWKWQGGSTPAITGTDGSVDIISGVSDGTNVYVTMVKNFS